MIVIICVKYKKYPSRTVDATGGMMKRYEFSCYWELLAHMAGTKNPCNNNGPLIYVLSKICRLHFFSYKVICSVYDNITPTKWSIKSAQFLFYDDLQQWYSHCPFVYCGSIDLMASREWNNSYNINVTHLGRITLIGVIVWWYYSSGNTMIMFRFLLNWYLNVLVPRSYNIQST